MAQMKVTDERVSFGIDTAIIVRVMEWHTNFLVGCGKGCIVAVIPYQSPAGKENALKIANQIVEANIDTSLKIEDTEED